MKADAMQILRLLKDATQFSIPIYQRTYSWTEPECRQLWDDILRAGKEESIQAHFVGSIVYIERRLSTVSNRAELQVIDGQQRLTTVSLIIEALACQLGEKEPVDGFSTEKLRKYYLLNPLEDGDRRYKMLLTQTDKDTLISIVDQKPLPGEPSLRLKENFEFFKGKIKKQGSDLELICKGLAKLMIVEIALDRDHDNPQLIFESMNFTGRKLGPADLIRNFILMGLDSDVQTRLYKHYWRPMEVGFGQEAYSQDFNSFMRHYLTVKANEIVNKGKVYEKFKSYVSGWREGQVNVEEVVADVQTFANYYCKIALGKEEDKTLNAAFQDIREVKVDVAYPFLLRLYQDYKENLLSSEELEEIIRLVESYVFRRAVCAIETASMNKTFATFGRVIDRSNYLESVKVAFLLLPSYRRFPKDDEFKKELAERDIYNFLRRSYLLRKLENYGRKERVEIEDYTIEHILPQKEGLSQEWREELGDNWMEVHEALLHTLGNLTLTGYNSEYSDRPFAEKCDMKGGFRESPLRLNKGLEKEEVWNEDAIKKRAKRLAEEAVKIWKFPSLPDEILEAYRPKPAQTAKSYSIDNYKHLERDDIRSLFESFRKEVLALDPCVTEEYLKHYISYKAETSFADIEPQAKRLRMSLNIPFSEIRDPHGIAKDITNVGRLGTGNVEVGLQSLDDMPYVLGLVRQAFEKQMGDESGEE